MLVVSQRLIARIVECRRSAAGFACCLKIHALFPSPTALNGTPSSEALGLLDLMGNGIADFGREGRFGAKSNGDRSRVIPDDSLEFDIDLFAEQTAFDHRLVQPHPGERGNALGSSDVQSASPIDELTVLVSHGWLGRFFGERLDREFGRRTIRIGCPSRIRSKSGLRRPFQNVDAGPDR